MTVDVERDLREEVVTECHQYVDRISDCVSLTATLLDECADGTSMDETVERIRSLESECDRSNRRITGAIADTDVEEFGLLNTRVVLNTTETVAVFQHLDEIANAAEHIADELAAVGPSPVAPYLDRLRELAACAVEGMSAVATAVTEFVELLFTPTETGSVSSAVATVRDVESTCDDVRRGLIREAFENECQAGALLVRDLAHHFDALVDAMEDVTDQLVLIASSDDWIRTEPDLDRRP